MDYRKTCAILIAALITASMATGASADVKWSDASWDDVLKQAKAQDKYIFVDFYTLWCGPCKKMDKEVYTADNVTEWMDRNAIAVKYDADKGFGIELKNRYRVFAYPTTILLDSDGKEIERVVDYLDADGLVTAYQGFTEGIGTTDYYAAQLEKDPDNLDLLKKLGYMYADAAHPDEAIRCLNRYLELSPEGVDVSSAFFALGEACYASKDFERAKTFYSRVVDEYPDADDWNNSAERLAKVEHKLGNSKEGVKVYLKVVARDPDDPGTLNGFAWFCAANAIGLDEALPIALKAVDISNRDPGILDTLAELYYARGEFDNAIKIGKEALASDPEDEYFNNQVKKFEAAKAEADERASN